MSKETVQQESLEKWLKRMTVPSLEYPRLPSFFPAGDSGVERARRFFRSTRSQYVKPLKERGWGGYDILRNHESSLSQRLERMEEVKSVWEVCVDYWAEFMARLEAVADSIGSNELLKDAFPGQVRPEYGDLTGGRSVWVSLHQFLDTDQLLETLGGVEKADAIDTALEPGSSEGNVAGMWLEPSKTVDAAIAQVEIRLEEAEKHLERRERTVELIRFKLAMLKNVLYRFEVFGRVGTASTEEEEEVIRQPEQSGGGRPRAIDDPSALPREKLVLLLRWVNRRSEHHDAFARFHRHVKKELGEVARSTLVDQLESFMDSLGVWDKMEGPFSNIQTYRKQREAIAKAFEEHFGAAYDEIELEEKSK